MAKGRKTSPGNNFLTNFRRVQQAEKAAAAMQIRDINNDTSRTSKSGFGASIDLDERGWSNLAGFAEAYQTVVGGTPHEGSFLQFMVNNAASRMVDAISVALLPLSRTGKLVDSFSTSISGNEVGIISSSPYALTVLGEKEWGVPSISTIQKWIIDSGIYSEEHSSARDLAGAMFTSWKRDPSAVSPRSTISSLFPSGVKAYDYVTVAWDSIRDGIDTDIVDVLLEIKQI